jgi:YesN/AraC family two-component response regulator
MAEIIYNILIVDDIEDNLLVLKRMIKKSYEDVKIFEAIDGAEALEVFKSNHIDVIVTDLQMPKIDGIELTRMIKEISLDTPVVMVTAFSDFTSNDQLIKAINNGVDAYLKKPVEKDELIRSIDKVWLPIRQKYELKRKNDEINAINTIIESMLYDENFDLEKFRSKVDLRKEIAEVESKENIFWFDED